MREIIFDTETTGLDAREDRIIEIGGIELVNRFPTGRTFHAYVNPGGRAIHPDALAVHGIGHDQLADKPLFHAIAEEFLAFVEGAHLVAHNAGFDVAFVNAEFSRLGHPLIHSERVIDTLALARRRHPMGPNSLDALCRRYGVDNARRTKHGALLDSELLAEVYIELIGGRQAALMLEAVTAPPTSMMDGVLLEWTIRERPAPLAPRLTLEEVTAHAALVAELGEKSLWSRMPFSSDRTDPRAIS